MLAFVAPEIRRGGRSVSSGAGALLSMARKLASAEGCREGGPPDPRPRGGHRRGTCGMA
jgi:hypothetical protein